MDADQGYESTLEAFETSAIKFGVDYVDLYLIHRPVAGKFRETWKALEQFYRVGKARAIGVCNFHEHHLEDLFSEADIVPMVNQVELHPLLSQRPLRDFCRRQNIEVEAYSPLGSGAILKHPVIQSIAEANYFALGCAA